MDWSYSQLSLMYPLVQQRLFVLIQTLTKHDIFLHPQTVVGLIEEVSEYKPVSICPENVKTTNQSFCCTAQVSSESQGEEKEIFSAAPSHQRWHPNLI